MDFHLPLAPRFGEGPPNPQRTRTAQCRHNPLLFFRECPEADNARLPTLIRNLKTSEMEWHGCRIFRRYHTVHLVNPGAYPAGMN